ncbi:hypothetical protein GGR57DRAFT_490974 [Xylariaceae sp. FL1272]|nr:hypothetical protein GGR57DRAFT_490974 [Xylariaceae sp. FL1272]
MARKQRGDNAHEAQDARSEPWDGPFPVLPLQYPHTRVSSHASTSSIHGVNPQHNQHNQRNPEHAFSAPHQHGGFASEWHPNPSEHHGTMMPMRHQQAMAGGAHRTASPLANEEMMLRAPSHIPTPQTFPMDSSMHPAVASSMSFSQSSMMHHGMPADSFNTNASFITDSDSQIMDREDADEADQLAPAPAGQKPGSSRTSANNELEMRQLFQGNKHRRIEEVARELHGNERGPNSERARQVFAMLWINQVCDKGKGSVPRGRVYANYASRCATERITVLNPASFGKLVRVLFPGLRTRRLGVRGESKYHYVNFTLMDDQPELKEPLIQQPALPIQESPQLDGSLARSHSQSAAVNPSQPALPSPAVYHSDSFPSAAPPVVTEGRVFGLYHQPNVESLHELESSTRKTVLRLSFPKDSDFAFDSDKRLPLPKIDPFLPAGTDLDAAHSLASLYLTHGTSLVDCIRFCKEKTFFHLYTAFQGTLTMPVQKLFANPSLALWIEQCDFVIYQTMMRIIGTLVLQVVPVPVLSTLQHISERLVLHIRDSFQSQPRHVVQAKEAPAAIFAALLDRALRVNLTAHAAANLLSNSHNRDQMYLEWITMVRIRKVAEYVPARGMDDVVQILLLEMRHLLNPVDIEWEQEQRTLYGDVVQRNGKEPVEESRSGSSLLEGWVQFLRSLPGRFPYASPADIVCFVERIGTAVIRDITIGTGKTFGSWWVTKCWLDEMVAFLAEQGGFMQSQSSVQSVESVRRPSSANAEGEGTMHVDSRPQSSSTDVITCRVPIPQAQPDRAPFPSGHDSLGTINPDDSGIGIRTPEDDDFPMEKFEFDDNQTHGLPPLNLDQVMS